MPVRTAKKRPAVDVREDFQQTPLWAPRVTTGADGRAPITLTLPDNLTTWRVDARKPRKPKSARQRRT